MSEEKESLYVRLKEQFLYSPLVKKASGSMVVNVASKGITFLTGVVLARVMTQTAFGNYTFAEAWINLLSFLAMVGMNTMLTREVSRQTTLENWGELRGLLYWSDMLVAIASTVVAIVAGCIFYSLQGVGEYTSAAVYTLLVAMLMVPLSSMIRIRQASIIGFGDIVGGQVPQMLVRPLVFVALVMGFGLFGTLDSPGAYLLRALSAVVALTVAVVLQRRRMPPASKGAKRTYKHKAWIISGLTFMAGGTVSIISQQLTVLLVGSYLGADETALFGVAKKGAEFVIFVPSAIYLTVGPSIAKRYAAGDMEGLQRLVNKTTRWTVISALVPAAGFILLGKYFLWMHGPEYLPAYGVLVVLTLSCLAYVMFGPTSVILNMTGFERHTAIWVAISMVTNLVASLLLMPKYGMMGAAVGNLMSMMVYRLGLTYVMYKLTNLRSFIRFY